MSRLPLVVLFLLGVNSVALPQDAADEGSVSEFAAKPNPFSPGNSPRKMDSTDFGFELTRELPLWVEVVDENGRVIRTFATPEIRRTLGVRHNRFEWTGLDGAGRPCEDGVYTLRAKCRAELVWRFGDPTAGRNRPGVLVSPHALALAKDGTLYVGQDDGNIHVLDASGAFVRLIEPELPRGTRRLSRLAAMVLRDDGKLLACDVCPRGRVVTINTETGAAAVLAELPERQRTDWLDGLAVDSRGRILVACADAGLVYVFSPRGDKVDEIGKGTGEAKLTEPRGVAVGRGDEVFVTDHEKNAGRIAVFSRDGKFRRSIKTVYQGGELPMSAPREVIALADGTLVVAEGAGAPVGVPGPLNRLAHISAKGKLLAAWGAVGPGEGEFHFISRLATDGQQIVASDHYDNHRVVRMNAAGKVLATYAAGPGVILDPFAVTRLGPDRYAVFDRALSRCTVLDRDGNLVGSWPYWPLLPPGVSSVAVVGGSRSDREVFVALPTGIAVIGEEGELLRTIRLGLPRRQTVPVSGLLVDTDGSMLLTGASVGQVPSDHFPFVGKLLVLDGGGKLLQSVDPPGDGAVFFGPVVMYDPKQPDRVAVQYSRREDNRTIVSLALLHIRGSEPVKEFGPWGIDVKRRPPDQDHPKVRGIITTVDLYQGGGPLRARGDEPLAAGNQRFFRGAVDAIDCYDEQGRFRWSLGGMRDKPLRPAALLHDGDRLLVASSPSGCVECWNVAAAPRVLAETTVEIDNTSPLARVDAFEQLVLTGDDPMVVRGTATDKNLERYRVYFRAKPYKRYGYTGWQYVRREDFTEPVEDGVLAEFTVSRAYRDRGIEVKVIAWDTAGNSSESSPVEIEFDDDGDGMSNSFEVAKGTDPQKHTEIREPGDVQIRIDIGTLMLPYLRADKTHEMRLEAYDIADPEHPRELVGVRLDLAVDAGQFVGGTAAGEGSALTITRRKAKLTCPNVDEQTIVVTATFPEQAHRNIRYVETAASFELDVKRDDDEDWLWDLTEAPASSDDGVTALRGNADSDGDGVIDGHDLAPRTSYAAAGDWSNLYPPGMIRYTCDFLFFGIGGGDSKVIKYGSKCSGKNILWSDRTRNSNSMEKYLDDLLFDRSNKDKSKRKPFEVVDWTGFTQLPPEKEEKIGVYNYGGTGHPEYYFHYYSLTSEGTPVIENIEQIDGTKYGEAGIHRNYLKMSFAGCDEYVDRELTIQWKITGTDFTGSGSWRRPMMRMAWLVEVFNHSDLMGRDRRFHSFAVGSRIAPRVYQATAKIPGEKIFRGQGLYVKLTPCWMCRTAGQAVCPNCRRKVPHELDNCPHCDAGLGRYSFDPVDKSQISVSGVEMAADAECVEWVRRLAPRGGRPMDADIFDEVCVAAMQKLQQTAGCSWPLNDSVRSVNVSVGGHGYRALVCSVRGMTRLPKQLKAQERAAHVQQAAQQATAALATVDAVCLIANTEAQLQAMADAVDWGGPGTWYELGASLAQSEGEAGAEPDAPGPTAEPPDSDDDAEADASADLASLQDAYAGARTVIRTGMKWRSLYRSVRKWAKHRGAYNLTAGDSTPFGEVLNLQTEDPVTGTTLHAQRSIAIQKRFDGNFTVRTRTVVNRPYTVWTDPKTGITLTDKNRSQTLILHRTERVADPDNSDLIARSKKFPGTTDPKWKIRLGKVKTAMKLGTTVVTNGLRIYQCYQDGDKFGMAVYFASGAVETAEIVAAAKGADNAFVNGLTITKTGGAKISLVGVAVGVLETGYNVYRWSQIDNPVDKNLAMENTVACAFDAGLGAFEPWGGVILASWTLGAKLGDVICDLWGMEDSPLGSEVVSSPGQALVFLPLHWLPRSVPAGIAKQAGEDAQEDAIDICKERNAAWNRKRTYLFVPPK